MFELSKFKQYIIQLLIIAIAYNVVASKFLYRVFYYAFPGMFFKGNALIERLGIHIPSYVPFEKFSFILSSLIQPIFLCLIIPFIIGFVLAYKLRWNDFDFAKELKIFFVGIAILVCFTTVFYGYNFYFDQAHTIDRLIILSLFVASIYRPAYSIFFLLFAFTSWSQGNYLLGNNSITDERIAFDLLIAIVIFIMIRPYYKIKTSVLIVFLASVFTSSYYYSGLEKIYISPQYYNWALENETWVGVYNMALFGWTSPLIASVGSNIYYTMLKLQPYIGVFVVLLELSVLILFFNRKVSISILALILLFHTTVFILLGLFFIKWFVIGALLLWVFYKGNKELLSELFSRQILACSILLLFAINYFYEPSRLSWWDTRLSNHYQFYVNNGNTTYRFSINNFAPYDKCIGFNRLHFMFDKSFLVVGDGISDYTTHNALKTISNISNADSSQNRYYDSKRSKLFIDFFQRYFSNRNKHLEMNIWERLTFPRHVWAHYTGENNHVPVQKVTMILKEDFVSSVSNSSEIYTDSIQINISNL